MHKYMKKYSLNKCLLSISYESDTVLSAGGSSVNKASKTFATRGLMF